MVIPQILFNFVRGKTIGLYIINLINITTMKKWFLILAVGMTAASCQWWHETFDDVEECTEWYLEEMAEADDLEDFEEIYNDFGLWYKDLGRVEQWKADKAGYEWREEHESKYEKIDERFHKIDVKYN